MVVVGQGSVEETATFKSRFAVPFPMIADPERRLFKAFQLKQASSKSLLSPGMALKGVSAIIRGHGMGIPQGDVRQLPGVFIIDTRGHFLFSHFAAGPADHPDVEDLIQVLNTPST